VHKVSVTLLYGDILCDCQCSRINRATLLHMFAQSAVSAHLEYGYIENYIRAVVYFKWAHGCFAGHHPDSVALIADSFYSIQAE